MEGKIVKTIEFVGQNNKVFRNYKFFLKGRGFWLSEIDFQDNNDLFSITDDTLVLKEPLSQFTVKEKKNKNGVFLILKPNLNDSILTLAEPEVTYQTPNIASETLADILSLLDKEKTALQEITGKGNMSNDDSNKKAAGYIVKDEKDTYHPKLLRSILSADPKNEESDNISTEDETKNELVSKLKFKAKLKEGALDKMKNLKFRTIDEILAAQSAETKSAIKPGSGSEPSPLSNLEQNNVSTREQNQTFKQLYKSIISDESVASTRKFSLQKNETSINNKTERGELPDIIETFSIDKRVSFIKGLLKISQQQQVNHRTRERLFSLVEKELGKTGGVEMEILRELHEIKSKLFPHDNVDLKAGTIHSEEGLSLEKPIKKSRKGLHKPRDVAEFMQLFEKRSGLKWLTHDFDNSESEFEIEIFLKQAKTIFDEFIGHHYLPTSLWRITHEFAFNENPQWGEKMYIKQGWSSPTWIDWSKSEKIHPMRNNEFYEIIQEFRRQTRIESPKLEILIRNELRIALKDEFSEWQVELIDCQKADFYTNTVFFKKALALIFDGIGKRSSISKKLIVKYIREVEGAYKKKVIKICHQDSFLTRPVEDLINEITNEEKGDFNSVKNYLYGYCDWMIETKYESDPIRITVLGEEKGVDIEFLDIKSKVEGFTHFLTFYTK
jgi:hypothetical protein